MVLLGLSVADPVAFSDEITYTTSSRNAESFFRAGIALYDNLYTEAAAEQFEKAIEIDPRFAMAYLYLARVSDGYTSYRENLDIAISLKNEVSEGERLIIDSYQARDENRLSDEIRLLRRLEAIFPTDVETHYHLAEVYFSNANYPAAVEQLERAITIDDEYPPAYNLLGYCYGFVGDFDQAISTLRAYGSLIPDEPNPHDSLGEIFLMAGQYDNAIRKYTETLEVDPTFYSAYAGRGHAYLFKGEPDKARPEYTQMGEVAPNETVRRDAKRWMAVAEAYQQEPDRAADILHAVMTESAQADEILAACNRSLDIAWVYTTSGQTTAAQHVLEDGWQTMMGSPLPESIKRSFARRYHVASGVCAAASGDLPRARASAEKIRRIVEAGEDLTEWEDYNWLMGEILLEEEDYRGAIANLLNASEENSRVLYLLGTAHERRGEREQARRYYDRVWNFNRPGLMYAVTRRAAEQAMN
jgi:tetratricopeptide (TPR) repeat protein